MWSWPQHQELHTRCIYVFFIQERIEVLENAWLLKMYICEFLGCVFPWELQQI